MSSRCHWPMHGPHTFASTVAPIASRSASRPSRSMVARTCSEPGVMSSGVFTRRAGGAGLTGDVRGAADVFVRRVRARPDERVADVDRVALLARRARRPRRSVGRDRGCAGRRGAARARRGRCRSRGRRTARGRRCTSGSMRRCSACASARSASASRPVAFRYAAGGRRRGTASTSRRSRRPCCRSSPCRWPRSTRRRARSTRRSRRCRPSP